MITKGIVEKIEDNYFARVRLPVYNGVSIASNSTDSNNLSVATICALPNSHPNLREGDIVFVGFEDNDMGKPIILGCLYGEFSSKSSVSITLNSLEVLVDTHLSAETTIGDTSAFDISNLAKTEGNLQQQINLLKQVVELSPDGIIEQLKELKEQVANIQDNITDIQSDVSDIEDSVSTIQDNVSDLQDNVSTLNDTTVSLQNQINTLSEEIGEIWSKRDV